MNKPAALKAMLLAQVPQLAAAPEKIALYVERGSVAARATGTLSFEYRYKLALTITDWSGDIDRLIVPLLAWIADQQPDLFEKAPHEPFTFESEFLADDAQDIDITLDLTELVRVERQPEGLAITHLDEPRSDDVFAGAEGATLWRLLLEDRVAGETIEIQ